MSKIGHYLQEHLTGEVLSSTDVRRHFATDGSIFSLAPALVVYPQHENDVRKVTRFSWQLAERNRVVPITARGSGTDQSGAALGSGVMLAFPAHMNRIVEFDAKSGVVTVEPGINYGKLQQTLMTHGRFLPPAPASLEYSTVGGAVANNASGEKSYKYGDTRRFVRTLRVVLANGEVIQTGRLSKRELNKKMGLATFEGEIYRSIDTLLEEHSELINNNILTVSKNTAGYNLAEVKHSDGSIDLTPLLVGSQGTLGVITEITLDTEVYNPASTLQIAAIESIAELHSTLTGLAELAERPSAIELVDSRLLASVRERHPSLLKGVLEQPFPQFVLLVEFDNDDRSQKKAAKRARKILEQHAASYREETDLEKQNELWKIRHLSAIHSAHNEGTRRAVPVIEDGAVPREKFAEYLEAVYALLERHGIETGLWGHAGDGNIHLQPFFDLSQIGDRQKAFKLLEEYNQLLIRLGGTTSGESGDGRLRAPYLRQLYGNQIYEIFEKVKTIFDPYNIMNPGVKIGVTLADIKPLVRGDYNHRLYDHLPRN